MPQLRVSPSSGYSLPSQARNRAHVWDNGGYGVEGESGVLWRGSKVGCLERELQKVGHEIKII